MRIAIAAVLILLTSCGPSDEERNQIAMVTCNVLKLSNDPIFRLKELNAARERLDEELFTGTDADIEEPYIAGG